jgi:hypothetical protein
VSDAAVGVDPAPSTEGHDKLVVMPDGGRVGFYSDWLAGPGWERFHTEELPQLPASRYRASDRRAVAGNSMGGLGALTYTAPHPGLFAAAASFSGIVHTRLSPDESRIYLGLIDSEGEHPYAVWGAPTVDRQIWAAHNPYDLAQDLLTTPLFISVGNGLPGPLNRGGAPDRPYTPRTSRFERALRSWAPPPPSTSTVPAAPTGRTGRASCTARGPSSLTLWSPADPRPDVHNGVHPGVACHGSGNRRSVRTREHEGRIT